ncbi:MAG: response regulator [Acidimicrobiales bacterium]|jgi:DNA-binding NarL/FixJ family response regulator
MRDLDPQELSLLGLEPLSVLIVDDAASTRRFLRAVLEHSPQFEVAGEAHDGDVAIEQAELLQPDLVLLDLSMPQLDGASALNGIVGAAPGAKVIIFSALDPAAGTALLDAGAAGFVPKGVAPFDLLKRLESIVARPATFDVSTSWERTSWERSSREPEMKTPNIPHPGVVMYGGDPMIRKMLGRMFRVCEVDVVAETYTAPILLAVVDLTQPKFVVLDLSAKGAPGAAVVSEIRLRSPRSVVVVYAESVEWEERAMEAGAAVFVTQPRIDHLAARIHQLVVSR